MIEDFIRATGVVEDGEAAGPIWVVLENGHRAVAVMPRGMGERPAAGEKVLLEFKPTDLSRARVVPG